MTGTVSIETITPDQARTWLAQAEGQNYRRFRPAYAKGLAEAMRAGEWRQNGAAVVFDTDGILIDGQHRLNACVLAGVPFKTVVYRGAVETLTIDTGLRRTFADWLEHKGEPFPKTLAAAVRWQYVFDCGGISKAAESRNRISAEQAQAIFARHPGLRDAVKDTYQLRDLLTHSTATILLYQFRCAAPRETADQFLHLLATGEHLNVGDPILQLRKQLTAARRATHQPPVTLGMAITVKAWNFWLLGRTVKILVWHPTGPSAEPFPNILTAPEAQMQATA